MAGAMRQVGRAGIAMLLFALLGLAVLTAQAHAEEQGATVFDQHGEHDFTVPDGIYWLTTEVEGAHGGTGDHTAEGGNGGLVTATIPVTPREVLRIFVGEYGGGHGGEGWGHGGDHGTADGALNNCHTASGGGGSSAVVRGSVALVGAGGGGGGGGDCGDSWGGRGGASGKLARDGENSPDYEPGIGTGGCGGCESGPRGADGHNAHYDESGGGGGGAGGGTTQGGAGGRDGSIGEGHTGTGGGGGGAGDSAVTASGALNARIDTATSEHDGSVTVSWGAAPSVVKAQSGGNQRRQILAAYDGLVAKVTDGEGIPAVGVDVRFAAPASGPSGTFGGAMSATVKTNRDGIAAAPPLRANAVAGEWTAIATVPGHTARAKFPLENIAARTSTTITSDANPSVTGQPVVFRADVRSDVPDAPARGTVQFTIDGAPYGDPVALTDGSVSAPAISDLAFGSHTIGAQYRGDPGHGTSSASLDQKVDAATTATTVTPTLNPAGVGDTVAFVAAVAVHAPASGVPTGSVQFARDGVPFGAPVTLDATGRAASPDQTFSSEGQSTITAAYTPEDASFTPSSGSVVESVGAEATATQLASSSNPSAAGEPVVVTAHVSRSDPGDVVPGDVTFRLDGDVLCGPAPLSAGSASCTLPDHLAPGPHDVRADFTGGPGYDDSFGVLTQQVTRAATRTVVSALPDPAAYGDDVRLRAIIGVVAPGTGTPVGTVQFSVDGAPAGDPVPVVGGVALSEPVSPLALGAHVIEAEFTPDARFGASHAAATNVITTVATEATITSDVNPAVDGRPLRFTVTVAALAGTTKPTGTVQLLVDGGAHGAPIPLVNGRAVSGPDGDLGVGNHTVTAHYHGYGPFETSQATMTQQVIAPPPTPSGGSSSASTSVPEPPQTPPAGGPGPIPVQPQPTLVLHGDRATVDGRGTLRLDLECRPGGPQACVGSIALRARSGGALVAQGRVTIGAGQRRQVALDLDGAGERLLDRRASVTVAVAISGLAADTHDVTLVASRAHRLSIGRATLDRGGRLKVRVRCTAARRAACAGTVRAGRGRATHVRVAGGRTRLVTVALDAASRRALARDGAASVEVRSVSTVTVGRSTKAVRRVEVRR